jgi:hypothetical protein
MLIAIRIYDVVNSLITTLLHLMNKEDEIGKKRAQK